MKNDKRILIVENDASLREAFATVLETQQCVVGTSDTKHYLQLLQQLQPTVAIVAVPYKRSSIHIKKIVSNIRQCSEKVHVLLSSTDPEVKDLTTQLGGNDFLEEPFNLDELLEKVTALFPVV